MADKKISALTGASTPLAGTEVLPIVQGGATVKVSAADVTAGRAVSGASFAVTGTTMPANGLYLASANNVSISANSKDYVYIASNGLVRVGDYGAGSAAPAYALTINNKDNYPVAGFLTGATYRGSLGYTFDTGYFGLEAAGRLVFHSSSVYAGEFDTAGNFKAAIGNVVFGTAGKGITTSVTNGDVTVTPDGTGKTVLAKNGLRIPNNAAITVGTGATQLSVNAITWSGLAFVFGVDGSGNAFSDLVSYSDGSTQAFSSRSVGGSPAARTYTAPSGQLNLAMASGSYSVFFQHIWLA